MAKMLGKEVADEIEFRESYNNISKDYYRLYKVVNKDLEKLLDNASIDVESITYRLKDYDKFLEKIERKKYEDPFNDIEDICGFRITCHYLSYVKEISNLLKEEFVILEEIDKSQLLDDDVFGYLSRHFIVKLKESKKGPVYRDLTNLKFEIQVRTSLQHVWADISHNLVYKKKEKVPSRFMRQLNRLSAILEEADERFDFLNYNREKYIEKLSAESQETGHFDLNQELNLDTFQVFLNFYLQDRKKSMDQTANLLDEIGLYNLIHEDKISLAVIWNLYDKHKENIIVDEIRISTELTKKEVINLKNENLEKFREISKDSKFYSQAGFIRRVLIKDKNYEIFLKMNL